MENNKKNTGLLIGIIVVLLLIVGGLISYILFGNSNDNKKEIGQNSNITALEDKKEESIEEKIKGECPVEKFDNNYVLTEEDKNELIQEITNYKYEFNKDSITVTSISEKGYYIAVSFDTIPKNGDTFGYVARVNGKLKFISAIGSGTTDTHGMILDDALERMCS